MLVLKSGLQDAAGQIPKWDPLNDDDHLEKYTGTEVAATQRFVQLSSHRIIFFKCL